MRYIRNKHGDYLHSAYEGKKSMTISSETKFFVGILGSTVLILAIAAVVLSRPTPALTLPKETLIPISAHTKGNKDANVSLVEYSDFQCPACGAFAPTVEELVEKNKNSLFFAYRHFPLPKHQFAVPAAIAAEAAGVQNKFWEAANYLFANQDKFSDTLWETMATDLSLDKEQFTKDLKAQTGSSIIDKDLAQATALNLPGTPTFFLNGVMLINIANPQDLIDAVNKAITSIK